ncbi:YkgJ family cysteine cluster protein [Halobacteriovorax sp. RZ-1]|uniref:YkgJ family cysteine cluster protein n=1 Tax=unclassified Halobacteriovorax TaxID=2639665 RepID=UPI003718ED57
MYLALYNRLQKRANPVERAQLSHELVDQFTNEAKSDPTAESMISCRKGCSACCHTQVSVNQDEAELLATRILEDGIRIDIDSLATQFAAGNDSAAWFAIPYEQRGCVFLDDKGACRVYSDRPSVCRSNYVVSDARHCDTSNGEYKTIRILKTSKADFVTMAAFNLSSKGGALPLMLVESLNKLGEQKLSKSMKKNFKKNSFKRLKELFISSAM